MKRNKINKIKLYETKNYKINFLIKGGFGLN